MRASSNNVPGNAVAILGGGPVGLALALLLSKRGVPSVVFDARSVEQARADRRLLALSLGSLQTLGSLAELPRDKQAPIRTVIISSVGQFGRAVIGERDFGAEILGATIRYGDLVTALSTAAEAEKLISVRRPLKVLGVQQSPSSVRIELEDEPPFTSPLALSAEGLGTEPMTPAVYSALIADLEVTGLESGSACERFTRDGPLALLPLPVRGASSMQRMALVWCMSSSQADRRSALNEDEFLAELRTQLGERKLRVTGLQSRNRFPLHERARDSLVEHRLAYLGNAAQTLHPVAGQGLNLGLRDGAVLAELVGAAFSSGSDPMSALDSYAQSRRADRAAIVALTRTAPAFFATRFAPIALARSIGLTALAVVPNLRREFARLLMFGVRF
ncbi:MAG TPA: FAD-dependent monooxygenase [Burkholderiaceae bacterium]|nr:FAD-dependent monooxygenase [Burkholderiaceae bacterium]